MQVQPPTIARAVQPSQAAHHFKELVFNDHRVKAAGRRTLVTGLQKGGGSDAPPPGRFPPPFPGLLWAAKLGWAISTSELWGLSDQFHGK